jgi:hypothetical protein
MPRAKRKGSLRVFRVSFSGSPLDGRALADALEGVRSRYEGTRSEPDDEVDHHRALVGADAKEDAIAFVREAMARHGTFGSFHATPVLDARGEVVRTPICTRLNEIDWDGVRREVPLSALQQRALIALLDDHEPTWIVAAEVDLADRETVEVAVRDLEARQLVRSIQAESGETGRESELEDWWALTDEGWDLLGLIKSPRYG